MNDEPQRKRVLGPEEIRRALTRIAHEILESGHGPDDLVLLGIPHRGVPLAERLGEQVLRAEGVDADAEDLTALVGSVDITRYRAVLPPCGWPCWSTAATGSCPSAPITSVRTCPPPAASGSTCSCPSPTARTRWTSCAPPRSRSGHEALHLDHRPDARAGDLGAGH